VTLEWRPLGPGETDHERVWLLVGLGAAATAALALYGLGLPPVVCPLRAATGMPCPTCGGTRAVAALLAGHPAAALAWNPLLTGAAGAWAVFAIYAAWVILTGRPRLRVRLAARDLVAARIAAAGITLAGWAYLVAVGR
jgi:hypothetical protein